MQTGRNRAESTNSVLKSKDSGSEGGGIKMMLRDESAEILEGVSRLQFNEKDSEVGDLHRQIRVISSRGSEESSPKKQRESAVKSSLQSPNKIQMSKALAKDRSNLHLPSTKNLKGVPSFSQL